MKYCSGIDHLYSVRELWKILLMFYALVTIFSLNWTAIGLSVTCIASYLQLSTVLTMYQQTELRIEAHDMQVLNTKQETDNEWKETVQSFYKFAMVDFYFWSSLGSLETVAFLLLLKQFYIQTEPYDPTIGTLALTEAICIVIVTGIVLGIRGLYELHKLHKGANYK